MADLDLAKLAQLLRPHLNQDEAGARSSANPWEVRLAVVEHRLNAHETASEHLSRDLKALSDRITRLTVICALVAGGSGGGVATLLNALSG